MKALTLWQPWATLIAIGAKRIETRDWETSYRGPLAIHSAARKPKAESPAIRAALRAAGFRCGDVRDDALRAPLPLGCVVAIAQLDRCVPTDLVGTLYRPEGYDDLEREYGNFTPGRWAWFLSSATVPVVPIPAKGYQKLWDWDVPQDATWKPVRAGPLGAAR